jgi:plastocyanin
MKYLIYLLTGIVSTVLIISLSGIFTDKPQSFSQYEHKTVDVGATFVVAQPIKNQVKIVNFTYEPANLKVDVGKAVRFINQDEEPHTVTAKDVSFDSKALDTDETWTHTFDRPGTFPYFCAVHPSIDIR